MKLYRIYRTYAHICCFIYSKEYFASKALQAHSYYSKLIHVASVLLHMNYINVFYCDIIVLIDASTYMVYVNFG